MCLLCVCVCPPQDVTGPDGGHEGSQPSGWTSCKEEEAETRKRCPIRYECFAAVSSFSWSFLCSLSSPVCVFSFCVSPAAVCEADEVSSPKGVHLNAAAASPLHWYDCLLILTCYVCLLIYQNLAQTHILQWYKDEYSVSLDVTTMSYNILILLLESSRRLWCRREQTSDVTGWSTEFNLWCVFVASLNLDTGRGLQALKTINVSLLTCIPRSFSLYGSKHKDTYILFLVVSEWQLFSLSVSVLGSPASC